MHILITTKFSFNTKRSFYLTLKILKSNFSLKNLKKLIGNFKIKKRKRILTGVLLDVSEKEKQVISNK